MYSMNYVSRIPGNIFVCIIYVVSIITYQLLGNTGYTGAAVVEVSLSNGANCGNGGTQIDKNTCL